MHSEAFSFSLKKFEQKRLAKPVVFICWAPEAKQVSLLGDFNGWNSELNPMIRQTDGAWRLEVNLKHGHHHYVFNVDGDRTLDPRSMGTARDDYGQKVSLIAVS